MARRKNIIRFPGGIHLNIGIIIFAFIAVYVVFNIYSYFTAVHIAPYEVEQGTIEVNTSYTGLILRNETVVAADQAGRLDYYLKDNTKAGNGTLICSVDENGDVSERIGAAGDTSSVMAKENLTDIQNAIREYTKGFQEKNFYATYDFKTDLSGRLMEAVNLSALASISEYTDYAKDNHTFHLYHAAQPGVVAYYTDGMESLMAAQVTNRHFDQTSYQKTNMKTAGEVAVGQPLYKLITDENWQIIVPVDKSMYSVLKNEDVIEIEFLEDNATAWANYTLENRDGKYYLILSLRNSMIRYAYERYIDIRLLLDQQTGLKIPNSAITTKSFELVPNEYFMKGNDTDQTGLLVEHLQEDGTYSDAEFIPATIFYQTKKMSYLSQDDIKKGDLVVMSGSTQRYEISDTDKLRGVYNINKGYAVFKQIDELYHNGDYTIVKSGTEYGITLYDHIALDGNSMIEDQMIGK